MSKVTFRDKIIIYEIPEQCECRNGNIWLTVAADRQRFLRIISIIENKIGYIFKEEHRNRISKYFEELINNELQNQQSF